MFVIDRWWGFLKTNAASAATHFAVALLIVLGSLILARVFAAGVERAMRGRAKALAPALRSLTKIVVLGAGIVTGLDQIGINVATVLAGAGIAGLAVGFGAQTLVKDVISGFFVIFDGVLVVGDQVKVGEAVGEVESIGLRVTQIRSFDGQLWYVPNGSIAVVANASRGWARVVVSIALGQEDDLKRALDLLQEVGAQFAKAHEKSVLETPRAEGILQAGGADVPLRLTAKVACKERSTLELALRADVKQAFDREKLKVKLL